MMRASCVLGLAALVCSCQKQTTPAEQGESQAAPAWKEVVRERLAQTPPPDPLAPLENKAQLPPEQIEGLLQTLQGNRRFARAAETELAELGESASALLLAIAQDPARPLAQRVQAATALTHTGESAARALLALATKSESEVLRRNALFQLGSAEKDWVIPHLLMRFKYETDPESFLWLSWALARLQNGSGLTAWFDLTRSDDPTLASLAQDNLAVLEQEKGLTATELFRAWQENTGATWLRPDPSSALGHSLWHAVGELSGDHFQLRGVDDARYFLSRLGPWAAEPLAEALGDSDPYVRLHVAQVLERMGPRARAATHALIANLTDKRAGPAAAHALGAIGSQEAGPALAQAAGADSPIELRIAAAGALGQLGLAEFAAPLRQSFTNPDPALGSELPSAQAAALLLLDPDALVLDHLLKDLPKPDGGQAEAALGQWLRQLFAESPEDPLWKEWLALESSRPPIPNQQATLDRRSQMVQWIEDHRSQLLP